jgi:2-polyprenyl-3-methyl-5-hydroxy-6-metoxy-1,4-benzoquinol methylase
MEKEVVFDYDAVFDVDDYMYFYSEFLTEQRSQSEVDALVELLALGQPQRILDLACGFGRHANLLAARGHQVVGVDLYAGFLEIARKNALEWGVQVDYRQADMRHLDLEGLVLEALLGGYDGQPVSSNSRRMVVVAKKP